MPACRKVGSRTGGVKRGKKQPDDTTRAAVVASFEAGMSHKDTREKYGVARSILYSWTKRKRDNGTLERREGSGRRRKSSAAEDHHIVLTVLQNRDTTSQEVAELFGERKVSSRPICRRVHELTDLRSHWKVRRPFVNARSRKRRVRWCMDRLHYTLEHWKRFLFTDESEFTVRFSQKTRVWRTTDERHETLAMTGTVKHDLHVVVWVGTAAHGVGNLYLINGVLEKNQYRRITRTQIIPSARKLFSMRDWTFQEDSDPKHTANSTKALYNQLRIPREEWPANSPDLNPTENLWQYLDVTCKDRKCNTSKVCP